MHDEVTSKGLRLRLPVQVAPVNRSLAGAATGTGGEVVPAITINRPPPQRPNWCQLLGLPPRLCGDTGGGTGPTFPYPPETAGLL